MHGRAHDRRDTLTAVRGLRHVGPLRKPFGQPFTVQILPGEQACFEPAAGQRIGQSEILTIPCRSTTGADNIGQHQCAAFCLPGKREGEAIVGRRDVRCICVNQGQRISLLPIGKKGERMADDGPRIAGTQSAGIGKTLFRRSKAAIGEIGLAEQRAIFSIIG